MTDLKAAAQQALEYMKSVGGIDMYPEEWAIVERLEAALAEPMQEPQHKPLTTEEVEQLWAQSSWQGRANIGFARAIEKAHGIK